MSLGKNIQFLRKERKITQEKFAEQMNVSRQVVSKWENDDVIPELSRLVEICEFFSCKLDSLVRENLCTDETVYSDVTIQTIDSFRMARYIMITPNPEADVHNYMLNWGKKSGLIDICPDAKLIGWDFPYISSELQNRFRLRGYVAAYILPDGFETDCQEVEFALQEQADYAVITIREPFISPFDRIPTAYQNIMNYLGANSMREKLNDLIIPCFEHEYEKNGITYMDIFVHTDSVVKANVFSQLG